MTSVSFRHRNFAETHIFQKLWSAENLRKHAPGPEGGGQNVFYTEFILIVLIIFTYVFC